jgi:glycerophosphoryl diester phosphodiesterase
MFLINSVAPPEDILRANGIRAWSDVYSAEGLKRIASFADIVGPETELIFPRDADGRSLPATGFVADAHVAGLLVHVWSVNAENPHLPLELRRGDPSEPGYDGRLGDAATLVRALAAAGVDGLFTDHPDVAITALAR